MVGHQNERNMNGDKLDIEEMRILVIEDDVPIADVVRRGLQCAGYSVEWASDGAKGLDLAIENRFAAIILDLMLPKVDGFQVCEHLRKAQIATPILMLTARDSVPDRVQGLESGADDYLVKPFEFPELLARIRALLRRDKVNRGRKVQIGYLVLDVDKRSVTIDGEEVVLKPREYALVEALVLNEGRVLSRDLIQERIWGNEDSFSNVVDVHVKRVREKVERPNLPRLIHTVHGIGYTIKSPGSESR